MLQRRVFIEVDMILDNCGGVDYFEMIEVVRITLFRQKHSVKYLKSFCSHLSGRRFKKSKSSAAN